MDKLAKVHLDGESGAGLDGDNLVEATKDRGGSGSPVGHQLKERKSFVRQFYFCSDVNFAPDIPSCGATGATARMVRRW